MPHAGIKQSEREQTALNRAARCGSDGHPSCVEGEDMPTIKYYGALSMEVLTEEFDSFSFRSNAISATKMTYTDKDGASVELIGTGFEYTHTGEVKDGTVSSITIRDADGHLLQTIKNIDPGDPKATPSRPADYIASAYNIYRDFKNDGSGILTYEFTRDGDHLVGSKKGDLLDGGDGYDHVRGGAGNDIIIGGAGKDHLTGDAGKDMFYFKDGDQNDFVTDFQDGQDRVELTQAMFDKMEKHQVGDDVVLDFGFGDQLFLENTQKASITHSDFYII
jgi:Ca2+-binding RTX toxin-like protein